MTQSIFGNGICTCECHFGQFGGITVACHQCCQPCAKCGERIRIGYLDDHAEHCVKGISTLKIISEPDPLKRFELLALFLKQQKADPPDPKVEDDFR